MVRDYYRYDPSLPSAIIFAVCFSLSAAGHAFQLVKSRTWYFIPFFVGCIIEAMGYIGRVIGATETPNWSKGPYIMQALLLLLGPPFYAASIYMVFGRLINLLQAEKHSLIRTKWLTKFFLFGDIASIVGQGIGGGKLAGAETQKDRDQGQTFIIVGLAIQIAFFSFFMVVTILFHLRINREPTGASLTITAPWRRLLQVLYGTSLLIMVRSVFRVIEYVMGEDGELQSKEVYIYVFDALLMFAASVAFNYFHPSRIINKGGATRIPNSDSENQLNGYPMSSGSSMRDADGSQMAVASQYQRK